MYPRMLRLSQENQTNFNSEKFIVLWKTHQDWINRQTVAGYLGLPEQSRLASLPGWCVAYPWSPIGPFEMRKWLPLRIRRRWKREGQRASVIWSSEQVMNKYFEVAPRHNFGQFLSLYKSIATEGFWQAPNLSDPLLVDMMVRGKDRGYVIHSGFHRFVIASYLGMSSVPATVRMVVNRDEVAHWSQVKTGAYTRTEALHVFDCLLEAKLLRGTKYFLNMAGL